MNEPTTSPTVTEARPGVSSWVLRLILVVLLGGAIGLVWWSLFRLHPLQRAAAELNQQVNRLSADIDAMESRWNPRAVEQLTVSYTEARGQIFANQDALAGWLAEVRQRAVPLALDMSARLGVAATQTVADVKLSMIPASVEIEVQPTIGIDTPDTPYQRVLRVGQYLASTDKRADITELTVMGGSNSVSRAVAVVNLWAGEEVKP